MAEALICDDYAFKTNSLGEVAKYDVVADKFTHVGFKEPTESLEDFIKKMGKTFINCSSLTGDRI